MNDLFALICFFSFFSIFVFLILSIIYYARKNSVKGKKQSKLALISAIVSIISFIGFGVTLDETETAEKIAKEESSENTSNIDEDLREENSYKNSENKQKNEPSSIATTTISQSSTNQQNSSYQNITKQDQVSESLGLIAATVSRVVDGDTFELSDGNKVRLIGVNTPESTTKTEIFGKEASNYTKSKLEGKQVYLQQDVSDTDRYGRLLRIVWLEMPTDIMDENEIRTKMFNADLVINGYAEPSTYPPDVTYSDYFVKFAREARSNETGLWAYGPEGTTKGDLDTTESDQTVSTSASSSQSTKEAISADSSPQTIEKEYFKNCTELRKVYPSGVSEGHPAYQSKMDRDKDGWACER